MPPPLFIANPENATIEELKQVSRLGSNETATGCSAIQMLLAGAARDLVCNALLVTNGALRKLINRFHHCGVDGLIVKKPPGKMAIINDQQGCELADLIAPPQQAARTFWTAKAFHGDIRFISKNNECFNYGQCLMAPRQSQPLASLATKVLAALFGSLKPNRAYLADYESTLVQ